MRFGPVEVHPFVALKESYSDNIFLTNTDKQDDFITTFLPGLQFRLPFRQHALSLTGFTALTRYSDHSSENTTDWSVKGAGDFNFGSQINLKVFDHFTYAHEPRNQSSTLAMEKFDNNVASASLTYMLADISKVQIDYANSYWRFKNDEFRSRDENSVSAYLFYRVLPKTSAFTEYEFKDVNFVYDDEGLDNTVHSALLGLTWELSEQSKGTVKGGYQLKEFKDGSYDDVGTFAAFVDISHRFSISNSIKLTGERTVNESSLLGTGYSITTGTAGEFTHKFLDRLSVTVKGSYSEERFSDAATGDSTRRNDQVVQVGASINYQFRRWMEIVPEYYWREKDSNIDFYDSTENNISLLAKVYF